MADINFLSPNTPTIDTGVEEDADLLALAEPEPVIELADPVNVLENQIEDEEAEESSRIGDEAFAQMAGIELPPEAPELYGGYTPEEAEQLYSILDSKVTTNKIPAYDAWNFSPEQFTQVIDAWKDVRKTSLKNVSPEVYEKIAPFIEGKINQIAEDHVYNEASPDSSVIVDTINRYTQGIADLPIFLGQAATYTLGHAIEKGAAIVGADETAYFGKALRDEGRRQKEVFREEVKDVAITDPARDNTVAANVAKNAGTVTALIATGGWASVPYAISTLDESGEESYQEVLAITGDEDKAIAAYNDTVVMNGPTTALHMFALTKMSKVLQTKKFIPGNIITKNLKPAATVGATEFVEENFQTASQKAAINTNVQGGGIGQLLGETYDALSDAESLKAGAIGAASGVLGTILSGGTLTGLGRIGSRIGIPSEKASLKARAKLENPSDEAIQNATLYDPFGSAKDVELLQGQIDKVDAEIATATEGADKENLTKLRNSYLSQKIKIQAALKVADPKIVGEAKALESIQFIEKQILGLKADQQKATTNELKALYGESIADLQDFVDVATRQGKVAVDQEGNVANPEEESLKSKSSDIEKEINDLEATYEEMLTESFNNEVRIDKLGSTDKTTRLSNLQRLSKQFDEKILKIQGELKLNQYTDSALEKKLARLQELKGRKDLVQSSKAGVEGNTDLAAELQTLRDRQKELTSKGSLKAPKGILPTLLDQIAFKKQENQKIKSDLDKIILSKPQGLAEKAFTRIYLGKGTGRFSKSISKDARNFISGALSAMQNVDDLTIITPEDLNNPDISKTLGLTKSQLDKAKGNARGFFIPDKRIIVFNKDVDFKKGKDGKLSRDATTLGHEVFHAIVEQNMAKDPEFFEEAYQNFLKYVTDQGGEANINTALAQYLSLEPSRISVDSLAPKDSRTRKSELITDEGVAVDPKDIGGKTPAARAKRSITRAEFLAQGLNKAWQESLPSTTTGRFFNDAVKDIKNIWSKVVSDGKREITLSPDLVKFKNDLLKKGGVIYESNLFKNLEDLQVDEDVKVEKEEVAQEEKKVKEKKAKSIFKDDVAEDSIFKTESLTDVEEFLTDAEKKMLRDRLGDESEVRAVDDDGNPIEDDEDVDGLTEEPFDLSDRSNYDRADYADVAIIDDIFRDPSGKIKREPRNSYFGKKVDKLGDVIDGIGEKIGINKSIKRKFKQIKGSDYKVEVEGWLNRADAIKEYIQEVGIENAFKGFIDMNSGIPLDARAALGDVLAQTYSSMANITRRHGHPIITQRLEDKALLSITRTRELISSFGRGLNLTKALTGYDTFDKIVSHVEDILRSQALKKGASGYKLSPELKNEIAGYAEIFLGAGKDGVPAIQEKALLAIQDIVNKNNAINWPELYTTLYVSTQLSSFNTIVANNFIPNKITAILDGIITPYLSSSEFRVVAEEAIRTGNKLGLNNTMSQIKKGDVDLDQQIVNFEVQENVSNQVKSVINTVNKLAAKENKTLSEKALLPIQRLLQYAAWGTNFMGNTLLSADDVYTRSVVNMYYIFGITAQEITRANKENGDKALTNKELRSRVAKRLYGTRLVDGDIVQNTFEDLLAESYTKVENSLGAEKYKELSDGEQKRLALKTLATDIINASSISAREQSAQASKEITLTNEPSGPLGFASSAMSQFLSPKKNDGTSVAFARAFVKTQFFPYIRSLTNGVIQETKWVPGASVIALLQKEKTTFERKGKEVVATTKPISELDISRQKMRALISNSVATIALASIYDEWEEPLEDKKFWLNGNLQAILSPEQIASLPLEYQISNSFVLYGKSYSFKNVPVLQGLFRVIADMNTSLYYGSKNTGAFLKKAKLKAKGEDVAGVDPLDSVNFNLLSRADQKRYMQEGKLTEEILMSAAVTGVTRLQETFLGGFEDVASLIGRGNKSPLDVLSQSLIDMVAFPIQSPLLNDINSALGVPLTKSQGKFIGDPKDEGLFNGVRMGGQVLKNTPWIDSAVLEDITGKKRVYNALNTFGDEIDNPYFWTKGIVRSLEDPDPEFGFLIDNRLTVADNDVKFDVKLPKTVLDYDEAAELQDIKSRREDEIGQKAWGVLDYAESHDLIKNYLGPKKKELVNKYIDANIDVVHGSRSYFTTVKKENSIPAAVVQETLNKDITKMNSFMRLRQLSDLYPESKLWDDSDQRELDFFMKENVLQRLKREDLKAIEKGS